MKKLKMLTIFLLGYLLLSSCAGDALEVSNIGDYTVDELFTKNGCTMYRFSDAGRYIYWSDCSGKTQYSSTNNNITTCVESLTTL